MRAPTSVMYFALSGVHLGLHAMASGDVMAARSLPWANGAGLVRSLWSAGMCSYISSM